MSKITGERGAGGGSDGHGPAFIVDAMLGRLARWLRILGFDTWYFRHISDRELVHLHLETGRILLTRDTGLVRRRGIGRHLLVGSDAWEEQLREVVEAFHLEVAPDRVLRRCLLCNRPLRPLGREEVAGRVPDYVAAREEAFRGCDACGRIYWRGTHRRRMAEVIERLRSPRGDETGGEEG